MAVYTLKHRIYEALQLAYKAFKIVLNSTTKVEFKWILQVFKKVLRLYSNFVYGGILHERSEYPKLDKKVLDKLFLVSVQYNF